jgi:hypothetical protein
MPKVLGSYLAQQRPFKCTTWWHISWWTSWYWTWTRFCRLGCGHSRLSFLGRPNFRICHTVWRSAFSPSFQNAHSISSPHAIRCGCVDGGGTGKWLHHAILLRTVPSTIHIPN